MKNLIFLLCAAYLFVSCGTESTEEGTGSDGVGEDEHRIFVSSSTTDGNMGGLSGADDVCEQLAEDQNLERSYRALLSDETTGASTRLDFSGPIYVVTGTTKTLVAGSEADLFGTSTSNLTARVSVDETGSTVSSTNAWTGTTTEGGVQAGQNCDSWTSNDGGDNGFTGSVDQFDERWIEDDFYSCNTSFRIYCVSQ